jgi:hypothetical protein
MNPSSPDSPGRSNEPQSVTPAAKGAAPIIALVRKTAGSEASAERAVSGVAAAGSESSGSRGKDANSTATRGLPMAKRPPTAGEHLLNWLTNPRVAAPLILICFALLSWSLLFRLPTHPLLARGRPAAPTLSGPVPNREEVNNLATRALAAISQTVTNTDQLPRIIAMLEQQARAAGFVVDLATRAPINPVPGLANLGRHPVVFRLENSFERDEPAFNRLVGWLRSISRLGNKVEFGAVTVESRGDGVSSATVEIGLLSYRPEVSPSPDPSSSPSP